VKFDFRYFFDFAGEEGVADSCVLIHNQDEFIRRLIRSVRRALPDWVLRFDGLRYIDPYFMIDRLAHAGPDIYLFKEFRFMYQYEYRLIAIPPPGAEGKLDHLYLNLGSLRDMAEFIKINP
jgi:hypothetical protein